MRKKLLSARLPFKIAKMKYLWIIIFCFALGTAESQNRNSIWCFGDSAAIDFSSGIATPISSGMDGRGSCATIANESGDLLFYAATMPAYSTTLAYSTFIFDQNHNIMLNGDSIFGKGWYQELVIVPNPANDSTYYLFSIGVTGNDFGLKYSIIDMRLNGGLGAVTVKNVQLQSFAMVDCMNAVKHGNGRDWWLIFRKSDFPTFTSNNDFYSYLITPNGIQNFSVQSIGEQNRTNLGNIKFSSHGDKMVFSSIADVVELFDFDRCTGLLSNPITIEEDPGMAPYLLTWSCEFSPDASKLYVTASPSSTVLFQYNLNAPNITSSKQTLWSISFPQDAGGGLKRAPDNKIYLSTIYYNGINTPYPYPDSIYNTYNMNLSVINHPDRLGASCDFQPWSFYLGGKRTYIGLPNNPDYELPALAGSPCDTLVGVSEISFQEEQSNLYVYYSPQWQTAFINANQLKGTSSKLQVFDVIGNLVFEESTKFYPPYYTKNLNCTSLAKGMYVVTLEAGGQRLVKKFVVE
ncbi:MAG: T9SS type A sorting domain-containing protein [Bacteroidetes bacterium]|nr:T9SS type A sorting domain-containing protein [Bacteroidota bacterium]